MRLRSNFFVVGFLFVFLLFSCEYRTDIDDVNISSGPTPPVHKDTNFLHKSLAEALTIDTAFWYELDPFESFESGFLLMDSVKHAFYVHTEVNNPSNCRLLLFEQVVDEWKTIDSLNLINFSDISFDLRFLDFNFDGVNDLFLRLTCSNGYAISRGQLFEFDPIAKKLILHPEVSGLGNFSVDSANKLLIAEEMENCPPFMAQPVQIYFEFKSGFLEEIKRIHHCEN